VLTDRKTLREKRVPIQSWVLSDRKTLREKRVPGIGEPAGTRLFSELYQADIKPLSSYAHTMITA
jgi:hypothetical protein